MMSIKGIKINWLVIAYSILSFQVPAYALSSLSKNDPYPVFSAQDPHDFLYTKEKLKIKRPEFAQLKKDHVGFAVSPFAQNADHGKNSRGEGEIDGVTVELGDLPNRWNMLTLLYGALPAGQTLPATLQTALNAIFPGIPAGSVNDPTKIDPKEKFGFFSIPITYRKRGVRLDVSGNLIAGFGLNFQMGVTSMRQTVTAFKDLTCFSVSDACSFLFTETDRLNVENLLMKELKNIAKELGINICDFCETSVEEVRFNLYWRHLYELNEEIKDEWPHVALIPFFVIGGSISPGKRKDPSAAFALPFGNNGSPALGFTAGVDFDFVETIAVGAEVGMTHFFPQDFCNFRLPTSEFQTGIFPFGTDVTVKPGFNWHFSLNLAAYHFLDKLSLYFQYLMVEHKPDTIQIKKPDPAFVLGCFEKTTAWKAKLANISMTYDIAPNIGVGFLWQAPISQRNAYKSTTLMFTLYATF